MSDDPLDSESAARSDGTAPLSPVPLATPPPLPGAGTGFRAGFWRTVFFVLRRMGRLPEEVRPRVERLPAKYFRSLVVSCAMLGLLATNVVSITLREQMETNLILLPVWCLVTWVWLRCLIGSTRWFLAPKALDDAARETAVAWSEYVTAPLALLVLLCPAPAVLLLRDPDLSLLVTRIAVLASLGVFLTWYVAAVRALRSAGGMGGGRAALAAVGILLVWAVLAAAPFLLLGSAAMWVLLYGSLA